MAAAGCGICTEVADFGDRRVLGRSRRVDHAMSSRKRKAPSGSAEPRQAVRETLTFNGSTLMRARLVLATLSARPVRITNIRIDEESPGLTPSEASFIRLLDKVSHASEVSPTTPPPRHPAAPRSRQP